MAGGPANRRRGELALKVNGEVFTLCLTLGALAEIETALKLASLSDLVTRLGEGRIGATELAAILAAALKGGGHEDALVMAQLGFVEAMEAVAELLELSFAPLMRDE